MHPDLLRRRESSAPQHRRPEDRVEAIDVLPDDVQVRGPPWRSIRICRESGTGEVVDQRVVPNIDCPRSRVTAPICAERTLPVLMNRERDPPASAFTTDGEIFKTLANEAEHLVASILRLYGRRILSQPRLKSFLVRAESEEPVSLFEPLKWNTWMIGADRRTPLADHITCCAEPFVWAVPPLISSKVDVSSGERSAHHLLCGERMVRICRANESIRCDQ